MKSVIRFRRFSTPDISVFLKFNATLIPLHLTCRLRWYLEPLLDRGNGAVEVRVTGGKYTTEDTVEEHVSLLIGESLQRGVPYAPYTAGGLVGDG